ncbi:MFS transporter [Desulfobacterota bacterium AH_259_B03_O07]|nr:MFS transporter [Desulfobacterota bacterium AH_259_B03_O07]
MRNIIAGCVGNVLEWYDFALYGFFAPVIAKQFFPSDDQISSLLATFGVFAVGFFMRPVGSVIFGILGDKLGRKKALEISVIMMAVPTTLIGVLPTHEEVGILAPILLTLIRLVQGVSVGGEFTGSISFVVEHAPYPPGRRGFYSSWAVFSLLGGILLGSAISGLVTNILTPDQVLSYGWRLPFFLGIVIGVIGLYLRSGLDESPTFKRLKEAGQLSKRPIREALQNHWREIIVVIGATCVGSVNFYMIFVYLTTFLSTETHVLLSSALDINTVSMVVLMVLAPLMGLLSDRIGRKPVMITGCLIIAIFAYPLFIVLTKGNTTYDLLSQLVFAVGLAMVFGPFGAMMVELFPTKVRMSAVSIGYNVGFAVFGGTAPFVATYLIEATGSKISPSYYLVAAALVSLFVFIKIRESFRDEVI